MLPQIAGFQSIVLHFQRSPDCFWPSSVSSTGTSGSVGGQALGFELCVAQTWAFLAGSLLAQTHRRSEGLGALVGMLRNAYLFLRRPRNNDQLFGWLGNCLKCFSPGALKVGKKNEKEKEANPY